MIFFLKAWSHIYTLKEKRQVRCYSEFSAFVFISKGKKKKKANTQMTEITLKVKAKSRV